MGKFSKRKKNFYLPPNKRTKLDITEGIGFLATCNSQQFIGIKEGLHLLNHYGDLMYGPEVNLPPDAEATKPDSENGSPENPAENKSDEEEDDLEASLKKEVSNLQAESKSSDATRKKKRFQVVKCGAPSHIFFRTTLDDPLPLILKAMEDIKTTGEQRSKHLIRLLPVHATCKAYLDKIEKEFTKFSTERFKDQEKSFYAVVNIKSNSSVKKEEVLSIVLKVMNEIAPKCKPVLTKDADVAIIVNVLVTNCFIGEAPEYLEKYKKYNLVELASVLGKGAIVEDKKVEKVADEKVEISSVPVTECSDNVADDAVKEKSDE